MKIPKINNSTIKVTDLDSAYSLIRGVLQQWVRDRLGFEKYPFDNVGHRESIDYRLHLGIDGIFNMHEDDLWILEARVFSRSMGPSDLDRFAGKILRAKAKHGVLVSANFTKRAIVARRMFADRDIDILLICITDLIYAKDGTSIEDIDCMDLRHHLGDSKTEPWLRQKIKSTSDEWTDVSHTED